MLLSASAMIRRAASRNATETARTYLRQALRSFNSSAPGVGHDGRVVLSRLPLPVQLLAEARLFQIDRAWKQDRR